MDAKSWIIIILTIIILLVGGVAGYYYHKYSQADAEVILINDSLYTYKNKYNEEYTAKNTYILKVEQLKQYNDVLYQEYKSLKDHPVVIVKPEIIYKTDTVYTQTDSIYNREGYVTWSWSAKDSTFYQITGTSSISYKFDDALTVINSMLIDAGITVDIIDDGQQLKALARSSNPHIYIPEMASVVIDPTTSPTLQKKFKQKKWGFGPYLGAGVNFGIDPISRQASINFGGSVGICISYHIAEW